MAQLYQLEGTYHGENTNYLGVQCTLTSTSLLIEGTGRDSGFIRRVDIRNIIGIHDRSRPIFGDQTLWFEAVGGNFFFHIGDRKTKEVKNEFLSKLREAMRSV